eukprot:scaffold16834_cov109-Skeletonema_dohrnii-CCMP3373.AAC.3
MPKTKETIRKQTAAALAEDASEEDSLEDIEIACMPMIKRGRKEGTVPPQGKMRLICKACMMHEGVNHPSPLTIGAFDKHEYDPKDPKKMKDACPASLPLHMLKDLGCHNREWFIAAFGSDYLDMTAADMAAVAANQTRDNIFRWIDPRYDIWDWDFNGTRLADWKERRAAAEKKRQDEELATAQKVGEKNGMAMVDVDRLKKFQEWEKAQAAAEEEKSKSDGKEGPEAAAKETEKSNSDDEGDEVDATNNNDDGGGDNSEEEKKEEEMKAGDKRGNDNQVPGVRASNRKRTKVVVDK